MVYNIKKLKGVIQVKTDMRISADNFMKLVNIFKENGWEVPESDSEYESRFNRFCQRLSILDKKEQELVIDLAKQFKKIEGEEYRPCMVKLLNQIYLNEDCFFANKRKLFVLPLLAPEDFNKTKSSKFVWYYFQDEVIKLSPIFKDKKLIFCDSTNFSWIKTLKKEDAILLLDDYIGSGETAVSAVNWIRSEYGINLNKIAILAIAAQEQGIKYIDDTLKIKTFVYFMRKKGISDYYHDDSLKNNIKLMTQIENKLKIDKNFSFGYNRSEALISLIKTPNNTFPVFWFTNKKHNVAPFLR